MSLYFGHTPNDTIRSTVSASVSDRGLNLLKAKPSDVQVTVIIEESQPGYQYYMSCLPAFMEATLSGRTVDISNRGYPIRHVAELLPWTLPPLIYDFENPPTDSKIAELRKTSHMISGKTKKGIAFVMSEPTVDIIKSLVKNEGPRAKTNHVIGTVNLDAMKTVLILQKIFSSFICTHTYAAFRHNTPKPEEGPTVDVSNKRGRPSGEDESEERVSTGEDGDTAGPRNDEEDDEEGVQSTATEVKLHRARPSKSQSVKWGSYGDAPNASGIYVPFVKDLAVGDGYTVIDLVSHYFLRCLASNARGMVEQIENIKSSWGVIQTTALGHEISHMAKCIEIALKCQCFIYPVYTNDVYEGCVICGARFTVIVQGKEYVPTSYESLQKVVQDSSAHSRSIEIINEAVDDELFNMSHCKTIRELSKLLLRFPLDGEEHVKVKKAVCCLAYPNKYWSTTAANIKTALAYLLNKDTEIPNDVPMNPNYVLCTSRVEEVLSAFGHSAPSFMIPNGKSIEVALKDAPKNFNVRTVPVITAVADMEYVMAKGTITNDLVSISAKHRDMPLKGPDKKEIWKMLKECVNTGNLKDDGEQANVPGLPTKTGGTVDDDLW